MCTVTRSDQQKAKKAEFAEFFTVESMHYNYGLCCRKVYYTWAACEPCQKGQLDRLSTESVPQEILEERDHYEFNTVFSFAASFIDRSTGFDTKYDIARKIMQYTDIVFKVLADQRAVSWVEGELPLL